MFIATYKDGTALVEGSVTPDKKGLKSVLTWDDIPHGIVNLQLSYPFRIRSGEKEFSPILTLGRYHKYFFYNEAITQLAIGETPSKPVNALISKTIAGIDERSKTVIEVKMDRLGNTQVRHYPLAELLKRIKNEQFRKSTIRKGII